MQIIEQHKLTPDQVELIRRLLDEFLNGDPDVTEEATAVPAFHTVSVCVPEAVAPAMPAAEMGVAAVKAELAPAMIIVRKPFGIVVPATPMESKFVV